MKFLECTALDRLNLFLNHLKLGDVTIRGNLDAFSCKHTGSDRKLSISLEHEILDYLGKSSDDSPSPVDHLCSSSSRKALIYLVLTLGHLYPDYDFSAVQAHLFFKEEELDSFKEILDTYLAEASRKWAAENDGSSLQISMLRAIEEVIQINQSEIYSYNPDFDSDPFLEEGAIWSFNFFFYNRKLKRVLSIRCCSTSNLGGNMVMSDSPIDDGDDEDMFDHMDM